MADIIELTNKAYFPEGGGAPQRKDQDNLWLALFRLPKWLFFIHPKDIADPYPFLYQTNGETWIFVFTDSELLNAFARENNFVSGEESALFIEMDTMAAVDWINRAGKTGLGKVQFNYGRPGWYAPVGNIDLIYKHLEDKLAEMPGED